MNRSFPCCGRALPGALGAVALLVGCQGSLDRSEDQAIRDRLIGEYRSRMAQVADQGVVALTREPSDVERMLSDERRQQLDATSGSAAYAGDPLDIGPDLQGRTDEDTVEISLADAVRMTIERNLDVQVARLAPAIGTERLMAAEAAFDAFVFANATFSKLDTPQPTGAIPGISGDVQSETFTLTTGVTQPLKSGGELTVSDTISRIERSPSVIGVPSFYDNDLTLSLRQPLLRGFGVDVNTAEIQLNDNAQQRDVQALHETLLDAAEAAEVAYWNLVLARTQLLIQTRLLQRTIADRDRLVKRQQFDAAPVQITEANSVVALRRGDVIRARQQVRDASDQLKRLIHSPALPVAGETLLVPADAPGEEPVQLNLLEAVTTALKRRPQLRSALLAIEDAGIRQRVADNAQLPLLDLGASAVYNGIDVSEAGDAASNSLDGDYIDYLLSADFELPIGNRAAKATSAAARLQRQQSVLAYQSQAQVVVLEVKAAMRGVRTAYELIGSTRAARRAAADNLRALQAQEDAGVALSPDFINLKLQSQGRLAAAEVQEIAALVDFNVALAAFDRSTGLLLDRNGVLFGDQ